MSIRLNHIPMSLVQYATEVNGSPLQEWQIEALNIMADNPEGIILGLGPRRCGKSWMASVYANWASKYSLVFKDIFYLSANRMISHDIELGMAAMDAKTKSSQDSRVPLHIISTQKFEDGYGRGYNIPVLFIIDEVGMIHNMEYIMNIIAPYSSRQVVALTTTRNEWFNGLWSSSLRNVIRLKFPLTISEEKKADLAERSYSHQVYSKEFLGPTW